MCLWICGGSNSFYFLQQDYGRMLLNYLLKCQSKRESASEIQSDETLNADTPDSVTPDILKSGAMTPDAFTPTPDVDDPYTEHHVLSDASDQQLASILRELANQVNATELPLTGNSLDREEEPVDGKNKKKENQEVQEKDKEGGKSLCDIEMDVDNEESEIKEDKDQEAGKVLPDVEDEEIRLIHTIDNLHMENVQKTVKNQSALGTEITVRTPQKESSDCMFEINTEPIEHRQREVNSTDNTESEDEDKANAKSERIHIERNGEQGKKDKSESREGNDAESETVKKQHSVKNKAHIEPETQSLLEIDKQTERPAESFEESEQVEHQESGYGDENEKDSVDNTGSEKRTNKENATYSQDHLDFSEEGNSEYGMTFANEVEGLNIIEEETHISHRRYSTADFADESIKEVEEITGKQKEPNEKETNEPGLCNERMITDEQTQESDIENESRGNLLVQTEEHSGVAEAEQCDDHTLKDVLDCASSGQEEFLSPEEIYKVRFLFDVSHSPACVLFIK